MGNERSITWAILVRPRGSKGGGLLWELRDYRERQVQMYTEVGWVGFDEGDKDGESLKRYSLEESTRMSKKKGSGFR